MKQKFGGLVTSGSPSIGCPLELRGSSFSCNSKIRDFPNLRFPGIEYFLSVLTCQVVTIAWCQISMDHVVLMEKTYSFGNILHYIPDLSYSHSSRKIFGEVRNRLSHFGGPFLPYVVIEI
jgi:hypothetical protein